MSQEFISPEPTFCFDADPEILNELNDFFGPGLLLIDVEGPTDRKKQIVMGVAGSLVNSCSEAMEAPTRQIQLWHHVVEPGKSYPVPDWHTDEVIGENRIVLSNCLPTEFAVGSFSSDSELGHAFMTRGQVDIKEDFDVAVEKAVSNGQLSIRQGRPYVATHFNTEHIHRSAVNNTDELLRRTLFKAIAS